MSKSSARAEGSELYDETYYKRGCGPVPYDRSIPHWGEFFGKIADELIRTFRPRRVFDAGCAKGFLVEALWDRGVPASGRDISEYAISEVRADVRSFCSVGSLEEPIDGAYDVITCIEVLEHMPEDAALAAISNMTAAANIVVFSSSPSDFTEPTHINVKPPIYWMRAFARHAFSPLIEAPLSSITSYALAFERRTETPTDEYLSACAEVVRSRMKQADDAMRIHELSVALTERTEEVVRNERAFAKISAERDGEISEKQSTLAELSSEREALASKLTASNERAHALQTLIADVMETNAHLHNLVSQVRYSKSWRARREVVRILSRLRLVRARNEPIADLLALARSGGLLGFDREFYLEKYPDIANSGVDPLRHYFDHGQFEGRVPSRVLLEKVQSDRLNSQGLRLRDLCEPEHEEEGPKLSDESFLMSVLTPTYNIEPRYIKELYRTLVNQSYSNWEWLVIDDGSDRTTAIAVLREIAREDPRVNFFCNSKNLGISGASNVGLSRARGSYVALVDHDDLVARHAFLAVYEAWKKAPETQIFYTDEVMLQPDGSITDLWGKPDWSPAYLEYTMYMGHLSIYNRDFLDSLGGFRSEFDGAQDFDLALRALLRNPTVVHLPIFAYLWRVIPGSAAAGADQKPYAIERQRKAVIAYAHQRYPEAEVGVAHHKGYWRIHYPLPSPPPLLSYIIPAGGGFRGIRGEMLDLVLNCIRSFREKAFYPHCEYVVVDNGGLAPAQISALVALSGVRLIKHSDPSFNFSRTVNAGVGAARGEYVCLLNDDVEAITEKGGEAMVSYLAANPDVAVIGPKCLFENGDIQQCGVVLLPHVGPAHAGAGMPRDFGGHRMSLLCRRDVFCVGAAMLIARKTAFEEVGGFAEDLPLNYNDVDFSVRIRERGYRCVIDPQVEVYHFESATKIGTAMVEQERFFRGRPEIRDPYFSKWFDPRSPLFKLDIRAPDSRPPFGSWLDRHIARRASLPVEKTRPSITICLLSDDQPLGILDEATRSVRMQTYAESELILADRGGSEPLTLEWLDRLSGLGVAILPRAADLGTFVTSLLRQSEGELIVFLEAANFLSVDALQLIATAAVQHPEAKLFYTDHYEATAGSTRTNPFFKPDFDPILLSNLWYLDPLVAARRDLIERVGRAEAGAPVSNLPCLLVLHDLLEGRAPTHIPELACARRQETDRSARHLAQFEDRRHTIARLAGIRAGDALTVEPRLPEGRLRLRSTSPVSRVRVLDARDLWSDRSGIDTLRRVASEAEAKWIAVLLDGDRERTLLELSAPAYFESRMIAICGVLMDASGAFRWSGGVFLSGGRVFDPNAGRTIQGCVYPEAASSQRCVDLASPINVMIRADALARVLTRFPITDADGLMVALGLDAMERGEFISVTPEVVAVAPPGLPSVCADRGGFALNHPALKDGSRWYDKRLEVERPYKFPGSA